MSGSIFSGRSNAYLLTEMGRQVLYVAHLERDLIQVLG
jgi:hypothetical protein